MNNYCQIKVTTAAENAENITAVMTAMDFSGGLMIEDFSDIESCDWDYADEALLAADRSIVKISGFIAESVDVTPVLEELKLLLPKGTAVEVINVAEQDWANNWRQYYKPLRVGKNIVIKPSWEEYERLKDDVIIELDPGMAFGTGTHETTRMCMALLERYVTPDAEILDIGCGSGILAITALLLGAKSAAGIDIDPVAVETAIENGYRNGLAPPRYIIKRGDAVKEMSGIFSIITANIIADVIITICGDVKDLMHKGGIFICSGIIDSRKDDVVNALESNGYEIIEIAADGEWIAILTTIPHR